MDQVIANLTPAFGIYENVRAATEMSYPPDRAPIDAPVTQVRKDLLELGYHFVACFQLAMCEDCPLFFWAGVGAVFVCILQHSNCDFCKSTMYSYCLYSATVRMLQISYIVFFFGGEELKSVSLPLKLYDHLWPKVYDTLDSQDFLLPQRRHRVWGIASVITGKDTLEDLEQRYKLCLASMRSNAQLPMELNFPPAPKQPIQAGRQQKLLAKAKELRPTSKNLFLDCSSSLKRIAFADGVCPCITPTHPIYSQAMERYLNSQDILNGQGLWRSCYNDAVYDQMLEKCAESLSGNSFSSTVVQAVSLACFISCPSSWDTVLSSQKLVKPDQGAGILRRLKRKQPAPEYDHCRPRLLKEQQPPLEHGRGKVIGADTKKQMVRVKKRLFKRKNPDMDSRKFNKGKKACSSIWQKEQVSCP